MSDWVATIGYEGLSPDALLAMLRAAGVRRVVDVRALANSRRPGFAKRALTAAVAGAGMEYLHIPALGTPAAGRAAVRAGRVAEFRAIYEAYLAGDQARAALAGLAELAREGPVCLLCLEALPQHCHRAIIAGRLGLRVTHLRADQGGQACR